MIFYHYISRSIIFILISAIYISCSEKDLDNNDPATAFSEAREYYDDENYDIAIQKLGEFKSRFPYSKHAVLAELFIANSQFELGNFEEAAVEYKQFIKLHPKHEKAPFSMFRIGESYWVDAPEAVDKDQELTETALEEWQSLLQKFPNSQYAARAAEKISTGKRRIAESHQFVADFYCKMEQYHACAYRFIKILEEFPQYEDIKRHSLIQASSSLLELSEIKKENPSSDKNIFFKNMSWQQIKSKAEQFKALASKIETPDS